MSANERDATTDEKSWGEKRAGAMPVAASVPRPEFVDCHRIATRIHCLFRDLRRQREAWADFDAATSIEAANPDVAAFNAEDIRRVADRTTDVLIDFVAGMIGDELRGAKP